MAYATTTYTGNGSTRDYTIGFSYISTDHISVEVDDVVQTAGVDYTIDVANGQIDFTSAPASNSTIEIIRTTPKTAASRPIIFTNGSALAASDLNTCVLYLLYILQEALDGQATFSNISLIDDDTMATASATSVATSESIKAYVDNTTGLGNVVEDTTPQLGGNLDVNGNSIVSTSNADINISPNGTGSVVINTDLEVDNIIINGNSIGSIDTNGDITIQPNGTGEINLNGDVNLDNGINVNSNTISSTATNTDLRLAPNGTGTVVVTTDLDVDNINIDGNTISSTDTNGDITIDPNGTGKIVLPGTVTLDGVDLDASAGTVGQSIRISVGGDFEFYTPATGGIGNVVEDTTPQLGGDLDANAYDIQFDDATGIRDDSDNETLIFGKTASAVNYTKISNAATGNDVVIEAAGDDTNIGLTLTPKGSGNVSLGNFTFDADATVGSGQDNYVMTYDDASGTIGLEAASGGGGGDWTLIQTQTASSSASISFTNVTGYTHYKLIITNLRPSTDNADLYMRTSSNTGSSYDSGASDYEYAARAKWLDGGAGFDYASSGDSKLLVIHDLGNGANETSTVTMEILNPGASIYTPFIWTGIRAHYDGKRAMDIMCGQRKSAGVVDAIQFVFHTGNIAAGTFKLYGIT